MSDFVDYEKKFSCLFFFFFRKIHGSRDVKKHNTICTLGLYLFDNILEFGFTLAFPLHIKVFVLKQLLQPVYKILFYSDVVNMLSYD